MHVSYILELHIYGLTFLFVRPKTHLSLLKVESGGLTFAVSRFEEFEISCNNDIWGFHIYEMTNKWAEFCWKR